jgi:8-oxo-dGTP pyrophosphatase MutT (NUDIX family)
MTQELPATEQDNAPLTKADAVISGVRSEDKDNPKAQEYVVAPYTEGRFGANDKYYVLAKGGIDKGENVLDAAIREASEETGIDIHRLLGEHNIAQLRAGNPVTNCASGYPGVRIRKVSSEALDYVYNSRENKPNRAVLLHIEVEGIEHLYAHLKNPENKSRIGKIEQVHTPLRTLIRNDNYPRFEVIFEWLRSMRTPHAKCTLVWLPPVFGGDSGSLVFSLFLSLAVSAIYNIFFVASSWQATPGKRWCNLMVVMKDGSAPSLTQSAYRHAASGISMLLLGAGYLTMAFNREKASLHDLICDTRVVVGKPTSLTQSS